MAAGRSERLNEHVLATDLSVARGASHRRWLHSPPPRSEWQRLQIIVSSFALLLMVGSARCSRRVDDLRLWGSQGNQSYKPDHLSLVGVHVLIRRGDQLGDTNHIESQRQSSYRSKGLDD